MDYQLDPSKVKAAGDSSWSMSVRPGHRSGVAALWVLT